MSIRKHFKNELLVYTLQFKVWGSVRFLRRKLICLLSISYHNTTEVLQAIEMFSVFLLELVHKSCLGSFLTWLTLPEPLWIHDHCLAVCPTFCSSQALDVPCNNVPSMQAPKENIILVEHTVLFFQNTRDPCSSTDALCDFINLVSEPVGSRERRQHKASFTHQTIKQTQHVICVLNDNILYMKSITPSVKK